jgi:hypothetical protein
MYSCKHVSVSQASAYMDPLMDVHVRMFIHKMESRRQFRPNVEHSWLVPALGPHLRAVLCITPRCMHAVKTLALLDVLKHIARIDERTICIHDNRHALTH